MSLYSDSLDLIKSTYPDLSEKELRILVTANLLETAENVDNAILESLWMSYKKGDHFDYETLAEFVLEVYTGKRDDSTLRKYAYIVENVFRNVEILSFDGKLKQVTTATGEIIDISVDRILEEKGLVSKLTLASNGISNLGVVENKKAPETEREKFEEEYYSTTLPKAQEVATIVENMFTQKTREDYREFMSGAGYINPKMVFHVKQEIDRLIIQDLTPDEKLYLLKKLRGIGKVEDV